MGSSGQCCSGSLDGCSSHGKEDALIVRAGNCCLTRIDESPFLLKKNRHY